MYKYIKVSAVAVILLILILFSLEFKVIIVSGQSMSPSYNNGQVVLIKKDNRVKTGDAVVFVYDNVQYIKRVVAESGDKIEQKNGFVYLNNIRTSYVTQNNKEPIVLCDNEYYVIGDNMKDSYDSRNYGALSVDCITGIVI